MSTIDAVYRKSGSFPRYPQGVGNCMPAEDPAIAYGHAMRFLCALGRHKPSSVSISRGKNDDYRALCDECGVPMVSHGKNAWRAAQPASVTAAVTTSPSAH